MIAYKFTIVLQAQNLTGPISSTEKLLTGDFSAVVAVREDGAAIGFAKFGFKSLYIYQKDGKVVECPRSPCLLDFYVSADLQRQGLGLVLFREAVKVPPLFFISVGRKRS